MSATIEAPTVTAESVWTKVDEHFWTASRSGEFLGTVERVDGSYLAVDGFGEPIGVSTSLTDAQARVTRTGVHAHDPRRRGLAERDQRRLAAATAVIGTVATIASAVMIIGVLP
jgi:hypothetical protein